jgi:hypothetical protein
VGRLEAVSKTKFALSEWLFLSATAPFGQIQQSQSRLVKKTTSRINVSLATTPVSAQMP